MKILMVIGQFHPTVGGSERQCLKLCKALKMRGHIIKVLTVWNRRETPRVEEVEGVLVERLWYPVIYISKYRLGFGFLASLIMFWRILKEVNKYDLVHVHQCLWPAFVAAIAGQLRKKPVICKLANSGERFDLEQLRRGHLYGCLAVWYLKRYIAKFIWISTAVHNDLKNEHIPEGKLICIPNGVELFPVTQIRNVRQVIHFIYTGTLTPKKNLFTLIEAIHRLPSGYQGKFSLNIFGEGQQRQALTDRIKLYSMEGIIHLQGAVDNVESHLGQSDIFILPSLTEGLSNSALEAMAYGLPVILSNVGGNTDLVETNFPREGRIMIGTNGILIDPKNVGSLIQAIIYILDHPGERCAMGRRSWEIVKEKYSLDHVVMQYERLYQHCLSTDLSR